MMYQTESKFQGWRAVAIAEDRTEHLVFLGRSSIQVRSSYAVAFLEILDAEERAQIKQVSLQRWNGAPDEGRWVQQSTLSVPTVVKTGDRALASA